MQDNGKPTPSAQEPPAPTDPAVPSVPSVSTGVHGVPPPASRPSAFPPLEFPLKIEILVVAFLAIVPELIFAYITYLEPSEGYKPAAPVQYFYLIVRSCSVVSVVAYLIWRSGDPWKDFGIRRVEWFFDAVCAAALCLLAYGAWWVISQGLLIALGRDTLLRWAGTARAAHSEKVADGVVLLMVLGLIANSCAEELVMRSYLIARMERLLQSTWKSVIVCAFFFASYHIYQGPMGFCFALMIGLLYGVFFGFSRRLMQLVIAHTIMNMYVVSQNQ